MPIKSSYPALWEKIVAAAVAVLIFLLVAWLAIRNQPFRDPNLVVFLRIVLSVAAAILGATIPGIFRFDWRGKGLVVRSGGALALFVASFVWSPTVVQSPSGPPPPPLTSDETSTLQAQGFHYAAELRREPAAASAFKADIEPIAKRIWEDPRYEQKAPQSAALIYRLYAATLLMQRPPDGDITKGVESALPWIKKAVELDDEAGDHDELRQALGFLEQLVEGKVRDVELGEMLGHEFRVAMPGAKQEEVEKHVHYAVGMVTGLLDPTIAGSSPRDDLVYLSHYQLGNASIGQIMEVMRITLKGKFPSVDVGGQPVFAPLPNGNTLVQYNFNNGRTSLVYEWEVSKPKELIIPKSDAAKEVMGLRVP